MKKILQIIQGSGKTGAWVLIGVGFLGVFFSVWSHLSVWNIVDGGNTYTGLFESMLVLPPLVIGLFVVTLLLVLRSVYTVIPVVFYFIYVFEKLFGTGIFRFVINDSIYSLQPALYSMLPLSAVCMLTGAVGTVLYRIYKHQANQ